MTIQDQLKNLKAPKIKMLTKEEKENIMRFYDRYGKLRTVSHFDLSIKQLADILKEWGRL